MVLAGVLLQTALTSQAHLEADLHNGANQSGLVLMLEAIAFTVHRISYEVSSNDDISSFSFFFIQIYKGLCILTNL